VSESSCKRDPCCRYVFIFPIKRPSSSLAREEQDVGFNCFLHTSFPAPYTRGSTITWVILPLPCTLSDHEAILSRKGDSWSHCHEPSTTMSHIICPEYKMFPGSSGFHLFFYESSFFLLPYESSRFPLKGLASWIHCINCLAFISRSNYC